MELHHDREIVTIAFDCNVIFVDPKSFEILKHQKLTYKVTSAALHPKKESYACGTVEGIVHKYDYVTDLSLGSYLGKERSAVCFLRFSPDGEICAMALANGNIVLWRQNMYKKYGLWTTVSTLEEDNEAAEDADGEEDGDGDGDENESMS